MSTYEDEVSDPIRFWPPLDGYSSHVDDKTATIADAIYAVAAELRTGNLIAFKVAQQTALAQCTDAFIAPIKERLGLTK